MHFREAGSNDALSLFCLSVFVSLCMKYICDEKIYY